MAIHHQRPAAANLFPGDEQQHHSAERAPTPISSRPMGPYRQEPIAVVGMACRLPGKSNSPHELWKFLDRGGIADNRAPETRFSLETHHDGSKRDKTMRSPGGMFLEDVDPRDFDAAFFGISGADAVAMDPQQRQLLEVVYECLENSGVGMEHVNGAPIACFVGSYAVDYADMHARDPDDRPPGVTIGVGRAILSNRISHFFNFKGPSITIDTACSGSLVSVDIASRYLSSGEVDGAVICGANLYLSPEHNMESGAMKGASSPSGRCWTFDARADGYIRAEGINSVYIKRLSDAIRDNDPIRAVIRGTATNSNGRTPGIASPSSEAQADAIRAAYRNAGIHDLSQTAYLECHGTGTPAGDLEEVHGAASVFSASRNAEQPLIIGSIKSNIGHPEPAAGISGLIKAVLAIEIGIIPGNPTFEIPNPEIDFHSLKVQTSRSSISWPSVNPFRRASVNSFGYGGSNAHVVLEETNVLVPNSRTRHVLSYLSSSSGRGMFDDDVDDDEGNDCKGSVGDEDFSPAIAHPRLLTVTANSDSSLKANIKELRRHLINPIVKVGLSDLAYTLNERRTHHFNRAYVVTRSTSFSENDFVFGKKSVDAPKIAFVFTGQGAQWSQMGKQLFNLFPKTKRLVQHLDDVLQASPNHPPWSLLRELTETRSPEHLRLPEFSQPLVTALQLAILSILEDWGIEPVAVVGHSSGEIAAAYAAGNISREDAIKAAFYRGQAAKEESEKLSTRDAVGMLAVGLAPNQVNSYIRGLEDSVYIACYNSSNSVTLSGTVKTLNQVKDRLTADGHFARMLRVSLAYHSKFMAEIGKVYRQKLEADFQHRLRPSSDVAMFSSISGSELDGPNDVDYWVNNMTSSVKFDNAVRSLLSSNIGVNFLVEIGPSGALAGPLAQIIKDLGGHAAKTQYVTALKRGKDSALSILDVVGKLYLSGAEIDFSAINSTLGASDQMPAVVVDLPNYAWDHTTKYWFENESSKDWRHRRFSHHDLLGSKVIGTSWQNPSWKKSLHVRDVPWLADHKMGKDVVFPAAGFISMGIEAIRQKSHALAAIEGLPNIERPAFRLRNITFSRALVLEENGEPSRVMISLAALPGTNDVWHGFKVYSLQGDMWSEHCQGLVRIDGGMTQTAPERLFAPLDLPVPGSMWYKAMHDAGYNFGSMFQPIIEVEALSGQRQSRSILSLEVPPIISSQSDYVLHPAALDGCLQTCGPSLWAGHRSGVTDVLVPAIIDNLLINSTEKTRSRGLSISSSVFNNLGRPDQAKSYISDASIYDLETKSLVVKLDGLRYHRLDTAETPYKKHRYGRLHWKPDVSLLSEVNISSLSDSGALGDDSFATAQSLVDLSAHKKPNLRVLEANLVACDTNSLWLDGSPEDQSIRDPIMNFCYVHLDAKALLKTQEKYVNSAAADFVFADVSQTIAPLLVEEAVYDLIIIKTNSISQHEEDQLIKNLSPLMDDSTQLLWLEQQGSEAQLTSGDAINSRSAVQLIGYPNDHTNDTSNRYSDGATNGNSSFHLSGSVSRQSNDHMNGRSDHQTNGPIHYDSGLLRCFERILLPGASRFDHVSFFVPKTGEMKDLPLIDLISINSLEIETLEIVAELEILGWRIRRCGLEIDQIKPGSTVLVLDELTFSIFPDIQEEHWIVIQSLFSLENRILWLTCGSQLEVTDPDKAMIHGLLRTVRNEDPSLSFTTLDVASPSGPATIAAIDQALRLSASKTPTLRGENELVERNGIIHVSRVLPDRLINRAEQDDSKGVDPAAQGLHASSSTVRMRCERLGNIDSLCFAEVDSEELGLQEKCVEVEIAAAGLNFKDVAVAMGIVPENEYLLGLEGAGTIRRVHSSVNDYCVGQRVLVSEKGTFSNRVIANTEHIHPIPDSMTFEEASTLAGVYMTALYSLYDLAGVQAGNSVLIHSASGGLGIASIQICQHVGAEVFATVGTDEKRRFLTESFGIPNDHIFSSRTTGFGPALMQGTRGKGVDIIINSLTGDLLDESWRCIANGGTMVELGKRDILDRNMLSMEPFGRNASYRCFDMSHKHLSDALIARLLRQLFGLLEQRLVKPISPINTFAFDDIHSAFRYMLGANHIGKIVISMDGKKDIEVPIRAARKKLQLNQKGSILIVGGLKGLCGSLAVYLARLGAKNIVIMGRSGYDDERSQNTIQNIAAQGCHLDLIRGDVASLEDVRRAFRSATVPINGVIQGAMVVRNRVFMAMTVEEYHATIRCKVAGTWNLHNVALEETITLDFFTLLSSISGLTGQKGQANYAAANVFLDSFAAYRRRLGLAANSVDLGAIEDVGYMSQHSDLLEALDPSIWTPINEALLHKIVRLSLLQQAAEPINPASSQLITGLVVPQSDTSPLLADARFRPLCFGSSVNDAGSSGGASAAGKELQAFIMMVRTPTDMPAVVDAGVQIVNKQFMNILRLPEPMELAKPLSAYGLDSLAAVEFRNWARSDLGVELATLDITNAANLITLAKKIVAKMIAAGATAEAAS